MNESLAVMKDEIKKASHPNSKSSYRENEWVQKTAPSANYWQLKGLQFS